MQVSLSCKFVLGCILVLLVAMGGAFYILNERQERFIVEQAEKEARAVFQQLVVMRACDNYSGQQGVSFSGNLPAIVWVEKNN